MGHGGECVLNLKATTINHRRISTELALTKIAVEGLLKITIW